MKNLIAVIVLVAAAAVAYFVLSPKGAEEAAPMTETETVPAVEAVTEEVEEAVETATDLAEEAADAVSDAVESATDAATEAVEGATEAVTDAVDEAVEGASDAADAVTDAATEATEAATETATEATEAATETVAEEAGEAATEVTGSMLDLLSPEGFDFDKVTEMVDGSELDVMKKTALKAALENAKDNPELLTQVLDQIKGALGL
ncbi:MAG: hypothetical protein ACU0BK_04860 [Shimia sp.]|jgi:cytoskeletal protein RodZ|uniref:hypothetical protein n=1 Tax=Shimia sp. TaxID=1954381 RepID=UPI0040591188